MFLFYIIIHSLTIHILKVLKDLMDNLLTTLSPEYIQVRFNIHLISKSFPINKESIASRDIELTNQ